MNTDNNTEGDLPAQVSPADVAALSTVSETVVVTWVWFLCLLVDHRPHLALPSCDSHTDLLAIPQRSVIFGTLLDMSLYSGVPASLFPLWNLS